jgi:glutaredoxin
MTVAEVVLYTRPGCAFCSSLRRRLRRSGVPFREVDIWQDTQAANVVRNAAGGCETVPTVMVGEVTLVNPSYGQVIDVVRQLAPELAATATPNSGICASIRRLFTS